MARTRLSDGHWQRLCEGLSRCDAYKTENLRAVIEGILWRLRTGAPWRDLPQEFGSWKTIYNRFNEWSKHGVWETLFECIKGDHEADGACIAPSRALSNCATAAATPRQRQPDVEMHQVVVQNPAEGDIAVGATMFALPQPRQPLLTAQTKTALKSVATAAIVTAFSGASLAATVWGYANHSCRETPVLAPAPAPTPSVQ